MEKVEVLTLTLTLTLIRCFTCMEKVEDYCCWRPNPMLQLFYLGLMAGGFSLYWMHSCPLMPNPRLALGHKIASVRHTPS